MPLSNPLSPAYLTRLHFAWRLAQEPEKVLTIPRSEINANASGVGRPAIGTIGKEIQKIALRVPRGSRPSPIDGMVLMTDRMSTDEFHQLGGEGRPGPGVYLAARRFRKFKWPKADKTIKVGRCTVDDVERDVRALIAHVGGPKGRIVAFNILALAGNAATCMRSLDPLLYDKVSDVCRRGVKQAAREETIDINAGAVAQRKAYAVWCDKTHEEYSECGYVAWSKGVPAPDREIEWRTLVTVAPLESDIEDRLLIVADRYYGADFLKRKNTDCWSYTFLVAPNLFEAADAAVERVSNKAYGILCESVAKPKPKPKRRSSRPSFRSVFEDIKAGRI